MTKLLILFHDGCGRVKNSSLDYVIDKAVLVGQTDAKSVCIKREMKRRCISFGNSSCGYPTNSAGGSNKTSKCDDNTLSYQGNEFRSMNSKRNRICIVIHLFLSNSIRIFFVQNKTSRSCVVERKMSLKSFSSQRLVK